MFNKTAFNPQAASNSSSTAVPTGNTSDTAVALLLLTVLHCSTAVLEVVSCVLKFKVCLLVTPKLPGPIARNGQDGPVKADKVQEQLL